MIARASQLYLPTLREPPADADATSHRLLVRGGFIRQLGAGLWTFLPLGWRVHRRIEQIVREEIDAWIAAGMQRPERRKHAKPAALAMAEASAIPLE